MVTEDDRNVYRFGADHLSSNAAAKKSLREYYDRFYESSEFEYYDDSITLKFLRTLLKKGRVKDHSRILDVGCAMGFYTQRLRDLGHEAVGIDISRTGILKGHERYPSASLTAGDASMMPFKERSFDAEFVLGCSLTNTRDLSAIRSYINYLSDYVSDNGVIILIGGSNFSGNRAPTSEWIYHKYDELLGLVDRTRLAVKGPYVTNLKLLATVGAAGLNGLFSRFARMLPGVRMWSVVYFLRKKKP